MWGDLNGSIVPRHPRPKGWEGRMETRWAERGVSRRSFLRFCAAMTATLALPDRYMPKVAAALERVKRPALVWLEFQDCAGCTESFLRASRPSVGDIALDILSVNYHETLMAPSGKAAEMSLMDTVRQEKGKYLAVVEGAIPMKDGGIYCTIGGRTALDIAHAGLRQCRGHDHGRRLRVLRRLAGGEAQSDGRRRRAGGGSRASRSSIFPGARRMP